MVRTRAGVLALTIMMAVSAQGAFYDNPYFPWLYMPISRISENATYFDVRTFITHANSAYGFGGNRISLYEIEGPLDLNEVAKGLELVGKPNPLDPIPQFKGQRIPFRVPGKVNSLGIWFHVAKDFFEHFTIGLRGAFMHVDACQRFILDKTQQPYNLTSLENERELELALTRAAQELGVETGRWEKTGLSDIDLYFGVGNIWHYPAKFRRIDVNARVGVIVPVGQERDINNTASLPFAGNGHTAAYLEARAEFELREDWRAGLHTIVGTRFSQTKIDRLPAAGEPKAFGAIVGTFKNDPRATFQFSPYLIYDDIHNGLGAGIAYTLASRTSDGDCYTDLRCNRTPPIQVCEVSRRSSWTAEYISVNVFYDLSRSVVHHDFTPTIIFTWDAPIRWFFDTKLVSKTDRISLGIQLQY